MRRKIIGYHCYFGDYPDYESAYRAYLAWRKPGTDVRFSAACEVMWDEPNKDGLLAKILRVFAIIFGAAVSIVVIATAIVALPAFFASAVPAMLADIKLALKMIYQSILPAQGLLRKLFDGINGLITNYILPTLKWTFGKVKELSSAIYQSYTLTIGGIVQTYDSLFGWVDGLRVKVNGILDNTNAIADVLGLDPNGKIEKLKQDFNELLDKWFVDWFDKILTKIDEAVGPILTKIGEIEAFASNILTTITDVLTPATTFVGDMNTGSYEEEDDVQDSIDTTTQHPPEEETEASKEVSKPYEPEKEKESVFDEIMDRYATRIYKVTDKFMSMVDENIEFTVSEMQGASWLQTYGADKDVSELEEGDYADDFLLFLLGDITFGEMMKLHWPDILFGVHRYKSREEALNDLAEKEKMLRDSDIPEEKIQRIHDREMKRINKKFPVPERSF